MCNCISVIVCMYVCAVHKPNSSAILAQLERQLQYLAVAGSPESACCFCGIANVAQLHTHIYDVNTMLQTSGTAVALHRCSSTSTLAHPATSTSTHFRIYAHFVPSLRFARSTTDFFQRSQRLQRFTIFC